MPDMDFWMQDTVIEGDRPILFTVGYRDPVTDKQLPTEVLLDLLEDNGITTVADVRWLASGGYGNSPYNARTLERHLASRGMKLRRFRELGNPQRHDPEMRLFRELMRLE